MKRLIATLCLLTAATCHALTKGDVPDATVMYSDADPFAIGVSTAAYTISTNTAARVVVLESQAGCSAATTTNIVNAAIADITPASIGALSNEVDTLSSVAARGGFDGTETISVSNVAAVHGNNSTVVSGIGVRMYSNGGTVGAFSSSGFSFGDETRGLSFTTTALTLTEVDNVVWDFWRIIPGTYTVASTADITAHNADAASHPDKIDAHTATNIAVSVQSSGLTYYLAGNTVSDRVSSMTNRLMTATYALASNAVNSITHTVPSNNFYVASFITASNTVVQPIAPGVIQAHAHVAFTDVAANSTAFIKAELYRKNAAGEDVDEIASGEILPLVEGGTVTDYTWAIPVAARIDGTGYRYGLKFKIVNSTISGADTITLQTEGSTLSRLVVPVNNGIYVTEAELPWRNGTLYGTNGTYRTGPSGTNYWILTP